MGAYGRAANYLIYICGSGRARDREWWPTLARGQLQRDRAKISQGPSALLSLSLLRYAVILNEIHGDRPAAPAGQPAV